MLIIIALSDIIVFNTCMAVSVYVLVPGSFHFMLTQFGLSIIALIPNGYHSTALSMTFTMLPGEPCGFEGASWTSS